jgi:hypothetical protein
MRKKPNNLHLAVIDLHRTLELADGPQMADGSLADRAEASRRRDASTWDAFLPVSGMRIPARPGSLEQAL